jgi:hypothetical protein
MRSLFFFIFLACSAIISTAQTPIIRARLVPAEGIIVGQPVHLIVEILVPNFFTDSPDFPTFELENAIVVLAEETPTNLNEQINGHTYAGIQRTYFIYPQQPGDFRLPPAQLTVPYAKVPPKTTQANLPLPQLTFHADIPAAALGLNYFLPTTNLTMQQRWSTPLSKIRVGDTVERTITVTTTKMQGMLIPPLPIEAPSGIRIYLQEPKVLDQKTDRGEFIFGRRIQSAKYLIQKEGDYTLPSIELKWWNLNANRLVTATLPTIHFIAAPNPGYLAELPPPPEIITTTQSRPVSLWRRYQWAVTTVPIAIAALFVLWLLYLYLPRLVHFLKIRHEQHLHSKTAYFRNLIRACRGSDAHGAYQWLLQWIRRSESEETLNRFLQRCSDEELIQQIDALTEVLFAENPNATWNGQIMANQLRKHRDKVSLQTHQRPQLPQLNP